MNDHLDNFLNYGNQNKFYFNKFLYFRDKTIEKLHSDYQRLNISRSILSLVIITFVLYQLTHIIKFGTLYPSFITIFPGLLLSIIQILGGIIYFILASRFRKSNLDTNKLEYLLLLISESLVYIGLSVRIDFGFSVFVSPCYNYRFTLGYLCPDLNSYSTRGYNPLIPNNSLLFVLLYLPSIFSLVLKSISWNIVLLCYFLNFLLCLCYVVKFDHGTVTLSFFVGTAFTSFWVLYESRRQSIISLCYLIQLQQTKAQYEEALKQNHFNELIALNDNISQNLSKVNLIKLILYNNFY